MFKKLFKPIAETARLNREKKSHENHMEQYSAERQAAEQKEKEAMQNQANESARKMEETREQSRQKGRARAEEFQSRPKQGITPEERRTLEENADVNLNRQMQGYHKKLFSHQGKAGIRGGAAFAQELELARLGQDAQGQISRDINQIDQDRMLKNAAAAFAIEEGEAANSILDRQQAQDEANLDLERKRQRWIEEQYAKIFERI